jgi:hypothetical protein
MHQSWSRTLEDAATSTMRSAHQPRKPASAGSLDVEQRDGTDVHTLRRCAASLSHGQTHTRCCSCHTQALLNTHCRLMLMPMMTYYVIMCCSRRASLAVAGCRLCAGVLGCERRSSSRDGTNMQSTVKPAQQPAQVTKQSCWLLNSQRMYATA